MPKLSDADAVAKLWHLAQQLPKSEDPGACLDCQDGRHMECLYENGKQHDVDGCACEFCC